MKYTCLAHDADADAGKVGILSLMALIWSHETFCHHMNEIKSNKINRNNPNSDVAHCVNHDK